MDSPTVIQQLGLLTDVLLENGKPPERYLIDGREDRGNALAVVAPRNVQEVQSLVKFCYDNDIRIVTQGARTGVVGGTVPSEKDAANTIILTTERLHSAPEYNPADGRIIVDAGFTLSEINEFLKPFGVKVAIDVSSDPRVGGMAATNIAGSRVLPYGDFRDMCIGVQIVFADVDATVSDTRNRPIKDNSDFNFTGLFVGSFGTLGIITSVALKVYPIIDKTATAWIPVDKNADLSHVVAEIKRVSGQELLACEFISRNALNALVYSKSQLQSKIPVPYKDDDRDVIFVEWGSASPEFTPEAFLEKALMELVEAGVLEDAQDVPTANTWDLRHRLSEAVQHSGKKLIGCDISTTCDRVGELRSAIKAKLELEYPGLVICDFGHLGDGGFHMNIVVPKDFKEPWSDKDTLDVRNMVSDIAHNLGGSFSAEHGLGATNTPLQLRYRNKKTAAMVKALKAECDPKGILGHAGVAIDL